MYYNFIILTCYYQDKHSELQRKFDGLKVSVLKKDDELKKAKQNLNVSNQRIQTLERQLKVC